MFPRRKSVSAGLSGFRFFGLATGDGFSNYARLAAFASQKLIVNPTVGLFQAIAQRRVRLPPQVFLDEGVVAVAAVHAFWRAQIVIALESYARKAFRQI